MRSSIHPSGISLPVYFFYIFIALLFFYYLLHCISYLYADYVRTFTLVCTKQIPLEILDYKLYKSIIIIAPDLYSTRVRTYVTMH